MKELINLIPSTATLCRTLLVTLRDNPEGVTIADRNGNAQTLDAQEIKALATLIENQIGEKTPKAPVAPKTPVKKQEKTKKDENES